MSHALLLPQAALLRSVLEPLFVTYGVDLYLSAHVHAYERTFRVLNGSVCSPEDGAACGPVHIVNGDAGDPPLQYADLPARFTAQRHPGQAGYGELILNATKLEYQQTDALTGQTIDQLVLTKELPLSPVGEENFLEAVGWLAFATAVATGTCGFVKWVHADGLKRRNEALRHLRAEIAVTRQNSVLKSHLRGDVALVLRDPWPLPHCRTAIALACTELCGKGLETGPLPVPTDAEALQELRRALEKNQRQLLQRLNFQDEVLSLLLCKPRDAEDSETPLRSQVQHPPEPQHERESSKAALSFQDSVDVICEREQAIAVDDEAMNMTQESRIMEVAVSMEKVGEAEPRIFRSITEQDARLKNLASQWELEDDDDEEALRSNASQSDTVRRRTTRNSDFPKGWRGRLKVLVQSVPFEVFFAIGIIANAIFIGAEVEYFVNHPGPSRTFFTDDKSWVWNWMDFVIVVSAITETSIQVVMALLYAEPRLPQGWRAYQTSGSCESCASPG
ncbi:unnamed protein product [Effrenium voratum]|nr:unnamed protein product [Effrenium voratum]